MARSGPRQVGLTAVAQEAGVSIATVSNTLNRPEMVSEATRAKVLAVIERMDFVPNTAAASLRRGNNRLIGLVVPDIANSFYAEIARGVTAAADRHRYGVILCNSQDDPARELDQLELLAEHRAAGALVVPLTADTARLERLRSLGTHLILIDRDTDDGCSTLIDDVLGGRVAAQHLIDTRGPGFVLVNGLHSIPQCVNRREGARTALADAGDDPDSLVEYEVPEMTTEAGVGVASLLVQGPLPTAVFCTNDQLAIGVIRGLTAHGVRVPEEVAVVGYGDLAIAADAPIPLTTVDQPKFALGNAAVEMLLTEIHEKDDAHHHTSNVFRPTLVIRESAPAA
jgi:LacI family transcriptional regulator